MQSITKRSPLPVNRGKSNVRAPAILKPKKVEESKKEVVVKAAPPEEVKREETEDERVRRILREASEFVSRADNTIASIEANKEIASKA